MQFIDGEAKVDEAGRDDLDNGEGSPKPKRSKRAPRFRRFCVTFFGPKPTVVDGVDDGRRGDGDGRGDGARPRAPGPEARSGQGAVVASSVDAAVGASIGGGARGDSQEEEDEKDVDFGRSEQEEEADSEVDARPPGPDEEEVRGGGVRDESHLSPLQVAAEQLAVSFRELLLADKQVCVFGFDNSLLFRAFVRAYAICLGVYKQCVCYTGA